jgi:hypothetical protein
LLLGRAFKSGSPLKSLFLFRNGWRINRAPVCLGFLSLA